MKKHWLAVVAVLSLALTACVYPVGCCRARLTSKVLTIYPLGDSITFGYSRAYPTHWVPGGYRAPLYAMLTQAGYTVHFVGSTTRNPSRTLVKTHNAQHDGWPGWRIDQIAAHVPRWLRTGGYRLKGPAYPDFILLHIGTNDIAQHFDPRYPRKNERESQFMDDLDARMTHFVKELLTMRPHTRLLVAEILPTGQKASRRRPVSANHEVQRFNAFIKSRLVPEFRRKGYRVMAVNQYANFSTAAGRLKWRHLMPDKVHPDPYGYRLMARTWFRAITQSLHQ